MEKEKARWIRLSFIISILLLVIKFYSYYITNSTAILTDAMESIVNVVAAAFASFSIYLSSRPRDDNHPYGHGKIEFFSAGVEGTLIILAGLFIIYQAIYNFFFPHDLENLFEGILLVTFSGLVNGVLGMLLQKKGKLLNSLTLEASGKHLLTDTMTSLLLVLGVGIIYLTDLEFLDSIIAIVFSIYIVFTGYGLVRKSVAGLMDEADPIAVTSTVSLINENRRSNWIDIHNMRVQQYGGDRHIDLHLTLPYYLNLQEVHDEVEKLESVLENNWPGVMEVFVHADPCIPDKCCHYCQIKDCGVRKYPMDKKIEWTAVNMSKNQKHYHETID
ncbi:Cobalt-zinc-cadmium resistance protein [Indibacter alkaliphilus LW1]|uniref:Cobalt-zinc-cadmium resistance protein n=1 Tax=Indibacter alkaliphilus (strain CCUG 57479 / KCTC 22604 / LW1) TaxID=1189612 RepID=S2E0X2_INDAL|nr:cation diffusion facilitator family transporter [Indibacter alkaliphilus]EOZ95738.1 Cobalt-zinc-cadmium resistance protein [Indibacter alkaliphilus LW1]